MARYAIWPMAQGLGTDQDQAECTTFIRGVTALGLKCQTEELGRKKWPTIFGDFADSSWSGPDGMSPIFFHKYCHIMGRDVSMCVLDILNNNIINSQLNFTDIVLLPKCLTSEHITDICVISFCNVVYKMTSKAIANCLKPFIDSLISSLQSTFVPDCLIMDNVLVVYELNHYLSH
ncbi:UNVERIFIED_CONTAM: hypothetical protein Scaly_2416000 [Sesamum calycinum]|uniref:Reverse transcriptase n=1 Tax=Sesamum calycinum TaxID=2727403 RepID=A0AAW2M150_9LAMI